VNFPVKNLEMKDYYFPDEGEEADTSWQVRRRRRGDRRGKKSSERERKREREEEGTHKLACL
jgi:hypothetical protein